MRLDLKLLWLAALLSTEASAEEGYKVTWMWGDANPGAGHRLARKNPLSWSKYRSPQETIAQLEREKKNARSDIPVDVQIVKNSNEQKWVDKTMDNLDAAIDKISKWTTEASAHKEEERILREAQWTRHEAQWMWGDAGINKFHQKLAEADPFGVRWSKWKSLEGILADHEFDYPRHRPVLIRVGSRWVDSKNNYEATQQSEFDNMDAAVKALAGFGEDAKVQWKWSQGRELKQKQGKAEVERLESWAWHSDKEAFEWCKDWVSPQAVIDDMEGHAKAEREKRNGRPVKIKVKRVYGDQFYNDGDPWDEEWKSVPEAIESLSKWKAEESAQKDEL